jgi:hypothetical protein
MTWNKCIYIASTKTSEKVLSRSLNNDPHSNDIIISIVVYFGIALLLSKVKEPRLYDVVNVLFNNTSMVNCPLQQELKRVKHRPT